MRKALLVLFIAGLCITTAKAQYKDGAYAMVSGEVVEGLIFPPNRDGDEVSFRPDKATKKRQVFKIEELSWVAFTVSSRKNGDSIDTLFVVTDGEAKEQKKYFGKLLFTTPTGKLYYKFKAYNTGGSIMSLQETKSLNTTTHELENGFTTKWESSGAGGYKSTAMFQAKGDEASYAVTDKNYIEVLSKVFADYPDLVQQIQSKKYKFKEMEKIFQQYNDKE